MSYRNVIRFAFVALACAPCAHAQTDACAALTEAAVKQIMTPHHGTVMMTLAGKTRTSEYITTADTRYLHVNGKWTSHPIDVKKEADETATAMKARSQTCKRAGDETLAGQAVMLYVVHSDDADSDSKIWIATASGLIIGQDLTVDGGSVTSIRYDYANVQPPKM